MATNEDIKQPSVETPVDPVKPSLAEEEGPKVSLDPGILKGPLGGMPPNKGQSPFGKIRDGACGER